MIAKVLAVVGIVAISLGAYQQIATQSNLSDIETLWASWKTQYGKTYSTQGEDTARMAIFATNYAKVQAHNAAGSTFTMALNKFADLTGEEFKAKYASCHGTGVEDQYCPSAVNCPTLPETNVSSVNWTAAGAVTPIKNQGDCGSCWAFSTTGCLEGLYYLNHSVLISFSEQQIVDCDTQCDGCDGCWPYLALEYTAQNGIEPEKLYPYKGVQGKCEYKASLAVHANTGYQCVSQKSVSQLQAAAVGQPVSVAVEADQDAWQLYSGGVVTSQCGDALDHAVLVTGYGSVDNTDAWIVKNSWGADWGVNGYIFIGQDASANQGYGVCGILRCGTLPINAQSA